MQCALLMLIGYSVQFPMDGSFVDVHRFCCTTIPDHYVWMRLGDDPTLAILSDWHRVREDGDAERLGRRVDSFVKLVEDRANVNVPAWWRRALRNGRLRDGGAAFNWSRDPKMWNLANGYRFSGFDGISFDEAGVCLFQNCETVRLSRELLKNLWIVDDDPTDSGYIGQIGEEDLVVGFHGLYSTFGGPTEITALDRRDLSIKWQRGLDIGFPSYVAIGGGDFGGSYSEIVLDEHRVMVFGGHDIGMYLNVLSRDDGRMLVRFATSYFDYFPCLEVEGVGSEN